MNLFGKLSSNAVPFDQPILAEGMSRHEFSRESPTAPPRVVIIGAGFGGLTTAQALRSAPVEITLIDRRNFHLFQPLLYQVATAALSPGDIAWPMRSVFAGQRNVRVVMMKVNAVDTNRDLQHGTQSSGHDDRSSAFGRFAPGLWVGGDSLNGLTES